jgi:PAS domain S-box-containing protein
MSADPPVASRTAPRFQQVFDQAPISMQLLAANGLTLQVNKAWEAMWQGSHGDALKQYVLHGGYNVLTDPQLADKGVTPYLLRAFAGESVTIPAIEYVPAELGIMAKTRWVTARAHPICDEAGTVVEVMLMHEDITDQVEADASLKLSEERFRSLVTASSQMVWNSDSDGVIIDDSPSWRAFTGQSYEEWKGTGWLNALHPDDRERSSRVWRSAIDNKSIYETIYRVRRADGEYRWTSVRGVPLRRADGSIREWIGTNTDITEQRRIEEAVRTSEQRLRFMLDAMHQKIFTARPDGAVDYYNAAWTQFTGLSGDDLRDWGWLQVVHPDDLDASLDSWRAALAQGAPWQAEQRFRSTGGAYRWHLSRALPMHDEAGRLSMWIGSNTDIHEVKIVESELARRLQVERRHSAVLAKVAAASNQLHTAASSEAIAEEVVHIVRDILEVHQAVISLTTDDNWGQAITAFSLSDKYAAYRGYLAKADGSGIYATVCRTNKPMRLTQAELLAHPDFKGFSGEHSRHPAMRGWLAVPLKAHDGSNIGLLQASDKFSGDFTEEDEAILTQLASIAATGFENARLYQSLQEQHRRKDEFLAMLAHELRNPLAPIRSAADLLTIANLGEARMRQTSAVISRQVQHMSSLIDDLLDISRVTRGLIVLDGVEVDIKRVVADALEQVRPLLEARRHALTVVSSPGPAFVIGDHKRLVQVLANILNNAAKYTQDEGTIVVRTQATADDLVLSVEDNGAGVAPELQPYMFDLFSQAARSSDRAQGGLGIGLALVKNLVGLHGGKVSCYSAGTGQGSRFTITLPRLATAPAQPTEELAVTAAPGVSGQRILVVDDNVDAADMLAMFLESAGHEVLVEYGAAQGLARALRERPRICVLDIGLPGMDGKELARRLRQAPGLESVLLVAATGYGSEQDRADALAAGFDHHLVKPLDLATLLGLFRQAGARA